MRLEEWARGRRSAWGYDDRVEGPGAFEALQGETVVDVKGMVEGSGQIEFTTATGHRLVLHHDQDCCESVQVVQVDGDASALVGHVVVVAEARAVDRSGLEGCADSALATFYHLRTAKGDVCIRWLGESNGYYSESVDEYVVPPTRPPSE